MLGVSNTDAIGRFRDDFAERLEEVSQIQVSLFQRILYVTFLEALAKAYAPHISGARDRFIHLLDETDCWPERNLVSVPLLYYGLDDAGQEDLAAEVRPLAAKMQIWTPYSLGFPADVPPSGIPSAVQERAPDTIRNATHKHLLYSYRNALIHESRSPTGFGFLEKGEPYYVSYVGVGRFPLGSPRKQGWELGYPATFLRNLTRNTLDVVSETFVRNDFNPYDAFPWQRAWHTGR